ncbi:MAG: site-specific integrase [Flavobacteriaceae bacterium]|nr:site-specific integrase [Flavobacteriaceae bacterium]
MPVKLKHGTMRKREDRNLWEIRYSKHGKRYSVYGKTQKEVITKQKEHLKMLSEQAIPTNQTLQEWLNNWIELYKIGQVKEKTLTDIKTRINRINKSLLKKPLTKITSLELQKFINSIEQGRTRELVAILLKDALDKAFKHQLIKNNPLNLVSVKKHKTEKREALTKEQTKILLKEALKIDIELKDYFLVMLLTGMRRTECSNTKIEDIDFTNKLFNIKGTKTKDSKRVIPISKTLEETLKSIIKRRNKNEKLLFKVTGDYASHKFNKIAKEQNWENVVMHSLRHTFATRCLEHGISMKLIQTWLGHSTMKMTSDTYSHIQLKYNQTQIKELDKMIII